MNALILIFWHKRSYKQFNRKVFWNGKKQQIGNVATIIFRFNEVLAQLYVAIIHGLIEIWYASIKFSAPKIG